jgi:hypothetical protein
MKKEGYAFTAVPCDVTDFESSKACVATVTSQVGAIDILVNNAGITKDMTFRKTGKSDRDAIGLLMTRMQNEPDDRHVLYLLIRQKLGEIKAYGMPLPEDLGLTGAGHGERSPPASISATAIGSGSGETRAGAVPLEIPRKGSYFPAFLEPRRASETALTAVIQEAYVRGACRRARSTIWSKPWA